MSKPSSASTIVIDDRDEHDRDVMLLSSVPMVLARCARRAEIVLELLAFSGRGGRRADDPGRQHAGLRAPYDAVDEPVQEPAHHERDTISPMMAAVSPISQARTVAAGLGDLAWR